MSAFTPQEIDYLQSQRLGRLATVGAGGQPHVAPVGFRYNPDEDVIDIGGHDFAKRKKWRDVLANPRVAFVVDDIASVQPWRVRGIEIRGKAEPTKTRPPSGPPCARALIPITIPLAAAGWARILTPARWWIPTARFMESLG